MAQGTAAAESRREGPHSPHEAIFRWLGLPAGDWPPDHYTLLGLSAGEANASRIENAVQDRIDAVRAYQLANPELTTVALNRLAEAYACLTDPVAKQGYDAERGIAPAGQARRDTKTDVPGGRANVSDTKPMPQIEAERETADNAGPTVVSYSDGTSPPVRAEPGAPNRGETVSDPSSSAPGGGQSAKAVPAANRKSAWLTMRPKPSRRRQIDPILEVARGSRSAVSGLGTRKRLYQRIRRTRRLLRYWRHLGRYLKKPDQQLADRTSARDFRLCLTCIDRALESFPAFFGRAGKPGYRVAILAQDETPVKEFQRMSLADRELLSLGWSTGLVVLHTHLQFLRRESKKRRHDSWLTKMFRPCREFLGGRGIVVLAVAALAFVAAAHLFALFAW